MDGQLLKAFLDYMYLGYTALTPDTVDNFSVLAKEMDLQGLAPMSCWSNQENTLPKNETMVNDDNNVIEEESDNTKNGENNCFHKEKNKYDQINDSDALQSLSEEKLRFNDGDSNIKYNNDRICAQECTVIVTKLNSELQNSIHMLIWIIGRERHS